MSDETFTLYDDCFSLPWILVKVKRHSSISLQYQDITGNTFKVEKLDKSLSELLQHEIDHLEGILCIDRALDSQSILSRQVYNQFKSKWDSMVDYHIIPTL